MTRWRLECTDCGYKWILPVSYRLDQLGMIYHYCRGCRKSTFHRVLERIEN